MNGNFVGSWQAVDCCPDGFDALANAAVAELLRRRRRELRAVHIHRVERVADAQPDDACRGPVLARRPLRDD